VELGFVGELLDFLMLLFPFKTENQTSVESQLENQLKKTNHFHNLFAFLRIHPYAQDYIYKLVC
jgi:hypothetical protein